MIFTAAYLKTILLLTSSCTQQEKYVKYRCSKIRKSKRAKNKLDCLAKMKREEVIIRREKKTKTYRIKRRAVLENQVHALNKLNNVNERIFRSLPETTCYCTEVHWMLNYDVVVWHCSRHRVTEWLGLWEIFIAPQQHLRTQLQTIWRYRGKEIAATKPHFLLNYVENLRQLCYALFEAADNVYMHRHSLKS